MGEVWKARDTRLKWLVAIKASLSESRRMQRVPPERQPRFRPTGCAAPSHARESSGRAGTGKARDSAALGSRAHGHRHGALHVEEAKDDTHWIELERGIRVRFSTGGYYEKGHYWLVAARAATGDIDWPSIDGEPKALRPHGVIHHYATLGVITKSGANWTLKP